MLKYCWFKQGDYIFRRRARKQHVCAKCGSKINFRDLYVEIKGKGDDYRFSIVRVCLNCFYSKDWVEGIDSEIRNAERFGSDD